MEAQLSGLPVVATRHAGIPEVVRHGESGWLVAEGDVAGMAEAIKQLAEDPELASRWGKTGRRLVMQHFTTTQHFSDVAQFLRNVESRLCTTAS